MQMEVGLDPVAERIKAAGIPTFIEATDIVYEEQRKAWKNKRHNHQWLSTLKTYLFPVLGHISVDRIGTGQARDVLAPIWITKHETARWVRQRIGTVMDWAVAKGYRDHPLPMAAINKSLPRVKKSQRHLKAIPYTDASMT